MGSKVEKRVIDGELKFRWRPDFDYPQHWLTRQEFGEQYAHMMIQHPNQFKYWPWCIAWCIDNEGFTGDEIRRMMEKPWQYKNVLIEFCLDQALSTEFQDVMASLWQPPKADVIVI